MKSISVLTTSAPTSSLVSVLIAFCIPFIIIIAGYNNNHQLPSTIVFEKIGQLWNTAPPPLSPPPPPPPLCKGKDCIASTVTIRASLDYRGYFSLQRYRFQNVILENNHTIAVYLPLPLELPAPVPRHTPDVIHSHMRGNGSAPLLPAGIKSWSNPSFLNISYQRSTQWEQPQCKRWEERPVYVLYTPHRHNIWHMLNDALMGAFQTLREEGLLPLAEIDDDGNMQEYTDDLEKGCLRNIEPGGEEVKVYRPKSCKNRRSGVISATKCSPEKDAWCRPGLVAVNRTSGPIFLLAQKADPPKEHWQHLYDAVSEDMRPWESIPIGTCFRELYIGMSTVLNLYVRPLDASEITADNNHTVELRRNSLTTFQRLVQSTELERATVREEGKKPRVVKFEGYADAGLEVLRRGIGPEDAGMLNVLREIRTASINGRVDYTAEEKEDMFTMIGKERDSLRQILESTRKVDDDGDGDGGEVVEEKEGSWVADARPVVTFMWRNMSRCVLNEADVLEYLLSRYNVTVRVTAFSEPLLEVLNLMNSTDVLIGMHGAGWTNGLFLKPGVAGLQMFPYGWKLDAPLKPLQYGNYGYIRGNSYKNIVIIQGGTFFAWTNTHVDHSFMRRPDFPRSQLNKTFSLHPKPEWPRPKSALPPGRWIYQNTVVSIAEIAPVLDDMMAAKGISAMV